MSSHKDYKPTLEVKQKISKSLKKAHLENRHPGWSHINLDINRRSYPEKFILKVLKNNNILKNYTVIEKLPIWKYFLDFALIELKLDIEVDGEQHYRNDDNIKHDKIRNEYLISKGWKIYRINWKDFIKNTKPNCDKLIEYINNINNTQSVFYEISNVVIKAKPKYGTMHNYWNIRNSEYKKNQMKYVNVILNSNINFSKFGWVSKVSAIINQRPQKVNIWMKKFMPDFYDKNCFKRNVPVSPLATNQLKG